MSYLVDKRRLALALALLMLMSALPGRSETTDVLERDGRQLELDIRPGFSPDMQATLQRWVEFLSGALLQAYGRWPDERWRITVDPADAAALSDPIPWGQVHRESINRVQFITATGASFEQLRGAWTGYHELAHLLIPYRGWGDNWFSEGLASYYQNILQARSGVLDEQQTWQKIYEGFERGRRDSRLNGQALAEVSDDMRNNFSFMRVYWSGAWYFLTVDARLRRQSGGTKSLDSALEKLNTCCAGKRLSVPQMVDLLDELNQVVVFRPLYDKLRLSEEMPGYTGLFSSLGISVAQDQVHLQAAGPGARLRERIVQSRTL
jgi:hypothetical protein